MLKMQQGPAAQRSAWGRRRHRLLLAAPSTLAAAKAIAAAAAAARGRRLYKYKESPRVDKKAKRSPWSDGDRQERRQTRKKRDKKADKNE